MTSLVTNYSANIDPTFPVAGQDNNSQGFRDNFGNIQSGLNIAATELTQLQANTAKLNSANNFNGQQIANAITLQLYGTVINNTLVSTATNIIVANGDYQTYTVGAGSSGSPLIFTFTQWPQYNSFARIRVQLTSDGSARYVSFSTVNAGTVKFDTATSYPLLIPASTSRSVFIEAWTYNQGVTVFVKGLGEFA
jgi:hypothetical protein